MTDFSIKQEETPDRYEQMGGRLLTSRLVGDEVDPLCHPHGPFNKLVIASGILGGLPLSSAGRLSIGAKSPLTYGIKESNAGGITAQRLGRLGIKALIIEGKPATDTLYLLKISANGCSLVPAEDLRGMGTYAAAKKLRQQYGERAALLLIGPAGEKLMNAAGIANIDAEGSPSRYAGRGGLGAVMGSKGLKAIVIDGAGVPPLVNRDPERFKFLMREYAKAIIESPGTKSYKDYGTSAMVDMTNGLGGLPTRNFTTGRFAEAEKINAQAMYDLIVARGGAGRTSHACMPGCLVQCSNVYPNAQGEELVSPLEYETLGLMGSNLEIGDLDTIAHLNYLCNDYGLDTIETGAAIGVAMQAGLLAFGDRAGTIDLVHQVGQGTVLGRLIGAGAELAGRVMGVYNIPSVKGQAMAAYEPRGIQGMAVTYATSPMGADHTAGPAIRAKVDHNRPQGQVAVSKGAQLNMALFDTLGLCMFVLGPLISKLDLLADLINAHFGWSLTVDELKALGAETLKVEREFNRRAGLTKAHDRIPEYYRLVPSPATGTVFGVTDEELDSLSE